MKCQINGNCCSESINIEIPALQVQQNTQTQTKTSVLFQHKICHTIFKMNSNRHAAVTINESIKRNILFVYFFNYGRLYEVTNMFRT